MWLPFWAIFATIQALLSKKKPRHPRVATPTGSPTVSRERHDAAYRDWYYNQYLPWAQSQHYVDVPNRRP
jgi:hypothetical protein